MNPGKCKRQIYPTVEEINTGIAERQTMPRCKPLPVRNKDCAGVNHSQCKKKKQSIGVNHGQRKTNNALV